MQLFVDWITGYHISFHLLHLKGNSNSILRSAEDIEEVYLKLHRPEIGNPHNHMASYLDKDLHEYNYSIFQNFIIRITMNRQEHQ